MTGILASQGRRLETDSRVKFGEEIVAGVHRRPK